MSHTLSLTQEAGALLEPFLPFLIISDQFVSFHLASGHVCWIVEYPLKNVIPDKQQNKHFSPK